MMLARSTLLAALLAATLGGCGTATSKTPAARSAAAPPACPAKPLQRLAGTGWPQALGHMVPGAPTQVRLCRMSGLNAHPRAALIGQRLAGDQGTVATIASELNRLPRFMRGSMACPNDDGSEIVARFAYRGGRQLTVLVGLSGCRAVTNGELARTALSGSGPALVRELERMTG
jgi:uncharacterized protein YceK